MRQSVCQQGPAAFVVNESQHVDFELLVVVVSTAAVKADCLKIVLTDVELELRVTAHRALIAILLPFYEDL